MNKVAVIMGAGASYDVWNGTTPRDPSWWPPLARELFSRPDVFFRFAEPYEGAKVAWSKLSPLSTGPDAFDLEAELRAMASDDDERMRRAFKEVPLCLRDLLQAVQVNYVRYPSAHAEFFTRLKPGLRIDAAFITLNYDCFIEKALASFDRRCQFASIDAYWQNPIKLFKIHGSIDWALPMSTQTTDWEQALWDFDPARRDQEILKLDPPSNGQSRGWRHGPHSSPLYPALTAPVARKGDGDIVCPLQHQVELRDFLHDCRAYLVVGSSGLDDDLLDLLRAQAAVADVVHVVAGTSEQAEQALARYRTVEQLRIARTAEALGDGFVQYIRSPDFVRFLKLVEGLPPR